jgi:hypothetical protein
MQTQAGAPFGEGEWFRKMIQFNIKNFFLNDSMFPLTILFLLMVLVFPFIIYHHRHNTGMSLQLWGAFSWCLLELYKPALAYLPGRYLVSTFFAMGLFSCVCIKGIYYANSKRTTRIIIVLILISIPVSLNIIQYYNSYLRRTYLIRSANEFVAAHCPQGCMVAGPWAPSVTWNTDAPSIPVWSNYFNDRNTMERFQPCIIVSEVDEEDSGNAWSAQGIKPAELSDTTYDFKIHNWHVRIYSLRQGRRQ